MIKQIQIRRGTAAALSSENEILADGELCYDQTNGIVKVGDGVTAWDDLDVFLGVDGAPGANAFEVAVEEGFEGDVGAWLISLAGAPGTTLHAELTDTDTEGHPGSIISLTAPPGTGNLADTVTNVELLKVAVDEMALGGSEQQVFSGVRRINGNIPLTDSIYGMLPEGAPLYAANQTTSSENGLYETDGTTTLSPIPTPTGPFVMAVIEAYAAFADVPSSPIDASARAYFLPAGVDFSSFVPGDDFSPGTIASLVKVGITPANYTPASDDLLTHLQAIDDNLNSSYTASFRVGSNTDLTDANYELAVTGLRLLFLDQTDGTENGGYITDGTTTLAVDPTFPTVFTSPTILHWGVYVPTMLDLLSGTGSAAGDSVILTAGIDITSGIDATNSDSLTPKDVARVIQPLGSFNPSEDAVNIYFAGILMVSTNVSDEDYTLPDDTEPFLVGEWFDIIQGDTGQITFVEGGGAVLKKSAGLTFKTRAQDARVRVQKIAADTWHVSGDLATA